MHKKFATLPSRFQVGMSSPNIYEHFYVNERRIRGLEERFVIGQLMNKQAADCSPVRLTAGLGRF
jgi:hypothetical protein